MIKFRVNNRQYTVDFSKMEVYSVVSGRTFGFSGSVTVRELAKALKEFDR